MTPLTVTDAMGPKTLTLDQARMFHAARHGPGVTLAWRFLAMAFKSLDLDAPDRSALFVDLSVAPPGITDAIEFVTRAVTRRRVRVRPLPAGGIVLALTVGTARVESRVRADVLPAGFAEAQRRDEAGLLSDAESAALVETRAKLDAALLSAAPDDLFKTTLRPLGADHVPASFGARPALADPRPVDLRDVGGPVRVTLEDGLAYHDRDHYAGVVLAHKILRFVTEAADADTPASTRDDIVILSGLNPPGLLDTFEVATRALSRQRFVKAATLQDGPESPFGHFSFVVHVGDRVHRLRLRDGLLPADFADVGRRVEAGVGSPDDAARWQGYKRDCARALAALDPADVLEPASV